MKKSLLSLAVLSLMCSAYKNDDDAPSPDSWQVGTGNFTPVRATASTFGIFYTLSAMAGTGASTNTITFTFNEPAKPTSGTYRVVHTITGPAQLSFSTTTKPYPVNTNYQSTGTDNVDAIVSVSRAC